jgi:uncharacterized protein (TIGR03067 family)
MDPFMSAVASNVVVATAVAAIAFLVSRLCRRPQLAHALWMLVLVKLITPPVIGVRAPQFASWRSVDRSTAVNQPTRDEGQAPILDLPTTLVAGERQAESALAPSSPRRAELAAAGAPASARPADILDVDHELTAPFEAPPLHLNNSTPPAVVARDEQSSHAAKHIQWIQVLYAFWLIGAILFAAVLASRSMKFATLLANSPLCDQDLTDRAGRLARQMGLARCPAVRVVDARVPPLVWGVSCRPVIILPERLLDDLDGPQREAVLLHELAHVARRDHLVRCLELVALVPFWWNPLAWWARRELRRAEEECCDAHVVWHLPESRREYGRALVKTLEFLSAGAPAASTAASAFGKPFFKRRIEMILKSSQNPKMSRAGWAAMLVLAAAVVPLGAQSVTDEDAPPQPGKTQDTRELDITADPTDPLPLPEEASAAANRAAPEDVPPLGGPSDVSQKQATSLHAALDRETAEKARFHGSWKVVETRQNGVSVPSDLEYYHWFFNAGESAASTQWKRDDGETHTADMARRFRFVVNPEASPKELTMYGDNKLIQAIYKWEDGRLVICFYGRSEKDRPGQFPGDGSETPPPLPMIEFDLVKDDSIAARSATSEPRSILSNADVSRALQRLRHSEELARKGYASDAQVESDLFTLKQAIERASKDSQAQHAKSAHDAALAKTASDYRRIEELEAKGLVSTTELDQKRSEYQQARADAKYSAIEREAQGQLLELDVAEARLKIDAAEAQLEAVRELHESNAVTDQELEQREYNLELAKIELKRAEIKLSLHRQHQEKLPPTE